MIETEKKKLNSIDTNDIKEIGNPKEFFESFPHRERVLLFYNPSSGNGLFKNNLDKIVERFQDKGFQVVPVRASKQNIIDDALKEMWQIDCRQVIIAGGDGTINICINSMIKQGIDIPISIFPTGTANDFAYYFDFPHKIEDMVEYSLSNKYTLSDVGKVNNRCFVNVAAIGNLIAAGQKVDPNVKNAIGVVAYYSRALVEIPTLRASKVRIITPNKTYEENMYFMVIMNGQSAGGFKKISPDSKINDGQLNVVLFREMPIIELAPLLFEVIQGIHPTHKNVLSFKTESLRIESDEELPTDVDGEKGEKLPLEFSVLHNKLKIIHPEGEDGIID
ncbi:MAG: diacylglycerol/lipid kinase family protein [Anaerovoracaceae bacterium]